MAHPDMQTMTSRATDRQPDRDPAFLPPDEDRPYWRSRDGQRLTFLEVVAGQPPALAAKLATRHAEAVHALARTAARERLHGDDAKARRIATAASRLCEEACGLWPSGSWLPAP